MTSHNKGHEGLLETTVSNDSNRANAINQQLMYSSKRTKGVWVLNRVYPMLIVIFWSY